MHFSSIERNVQSTLASQPRVAGYPDAGAGGVLV
jgi:hypothetical protein